MSPNAFTLCIILLKNNRQDISDHELNEKKLQARINALENSIKQNEKEKYDLRIQLASTEENMKKQVSQYKVELSFKSAVFNASYKHNDVFRQNSKWQTA